MLKQQETSLKAEIDTQLLSDFIYDLNIARRKLALYPEDHPQIADSCTIVLNILKKLCQFRDEITLGIAPEALIFDQNWLDENNPVYRDCARFFSARNVASISFNQSLETDELNRFNKILSRDKLSLEEDGGLALLAEKEQLNHITIIPVDYSHFQIGASAAHPAKGKSNQLWETFINGLLEEKLDRDGEAAEQGNSLDAELVAQILNRKDDQKTGKKSDYNETISSFIASLKYQNQQTNNEAGEQLNALIKHLNPDLKRNFLNSTFQTLEQNPDTSESLLSSLPQELITESLNQHNCEQVNISTRLIDLMGQFSTTPTNQSNRNLKTSVSPLSDEILKARVEILLLEDNHDEYIPNNYQKALSKILTGHVKGNLEYKTAQRLKNNLERQSVERQCCAILFNMLNNRVAQSVELQIQDNLAELSRFFLETGDFTSLQEIFIRWSEYLYSDHASARFLDEKVLADHTRENFMNDVLESVELWGQDKYDEICRYIKEVGEPYAELLIERLGNDEQMSQRKTWMKFLVELGSKGHQVILQSLDDQRWFLIRNLLIVLGQQRDVAPMKAVHQLTSHPHPRVRQEALRIIFRHNPATANRLLLKELSSGNKEALQSAIQLAEYSQDPKILHQLHHLIQSETQSDEELVQKKNIISTLAYLGTPESIPILAKLLKRKGFIRSRRQKELQLEIIKHLGAFPQHASEPLLNSIINGRDRAQSQMAIKQLQKQGPAEDRP